MYDPLDEEQQIMDERYDSICKKTRCGKLPKAIRLTDPIGELDISVCSVMPEESTLMQVVREMQEKSLWCVLVEDGNELSGIFTERDLLTKVVAHGLDYNVEMIRDYMTRNPETLGPEDPLAFAINKMLDGGFRNIPVIDDDRHPLGVINMSCIVCYIGEYWHDEIMNLPPRPLRRQTRREGP